MSHKRRHGRSPDHPEVKPLKGEMPEQPKANPGKIDSHVGHDKAEAKTKTIAPEDGGPKTAEPTILASRSTCLPEDYLGRAVTGGRSEAARSVLKLEDYLGPAESPTASLIAGHAFHPNPLIGLRPQIADHYGPRVQDSQNTRVSGPWLTIVLVGVLILVLGGGIVWLLW